MIRLLTALLTALALAFSPVVAHAGAFGQDSMTGCGMQKMPAKSADHAKMDCCTPACQAPASAAFMPSKDTSDQVRLARVELLIGMPVKELSGITSSGLDPPPRA